MILTKLLTPLTSFSVFTGGITEMNLIDNYEVMVEGNQLIGIENKGIEYLFEGEDLTLDDGYDYYDLMFKENTLSYAGEDIYRISLENGIAKIESHELEDSISDYMMESGGAGSSVPPVDDGDNENPFPENNDLIRLDTNEWDSQLEFWTSTKENLYDYVYSEFLATNDVNYEYENSVTLLGFENKSNNDSNKFYGESCFIVSMYNTISYLNDENLLSIKFSESYMIDKVVEIGIANGWTASHGLEFVTNDDSLEALNDMLDYFGYNYGDFNKTLYHHSLETLRWGIKRKVLENKPSIIAVGLSNYYDNHTITARGIVRFNYNKKYSIINRREYANFIEVADGWSSQMSYFPLKGDYDLLNNYWGSHVIS